MKVEDTVMSEEQLEKIEKDYLNEDYSVNAIRLNIKGLSFVRLSTIGFLKKEGVKSASHQN